MAPVFPVDPRRPRRRVRAAVPAGVDTQLVVGIVVDRVGDVAIGVRQLGGPAQGIDFHLPDQVQAAAGRRAPAAGQAAERRRLRRVYVGDPFNHCPGRRVVGRVVEEADLEDEEPGAWQASPMAASGLHVPLPVA